MKTKPEFEIRNTPAPLNAKSFSKYGTALRAVQKHMEAIAQEMKRMLNDPSTRTSQVAFAAVNYTKANEAYQVISGLCYDGVAHPYWTKRVDKKLLKQFMTSTKVDVTDDIQRCPRYARPSWFLIGGKEAIEYFA